MKPEGAAALILAAGFSQRMGDFKPLLDLGGLTVVERVIRLFRSTGVQCVLVVVGHRAQEVIPLIETCGARAISNTQYEKGMFSSVAVGVAALDEKTRAFFVLPVDIPLVRPATVRDLLAAFPAGDAAICHPTFGGRRGHPPLIGCRHKEAILKWGAPGGLGTLLGRLERHALEVAVIDKFIHQDLDRPEDYRRMVERFKRRDVLSPTECAGLLNDRLKVLPAVAAHGRAVAEMALRMGRALNAAGFPLNLDLIYAAALVHDMARGAPEHARRGAQLLRELDMPQMADIVATHMDLTVVEEDPIREAEVVFLADKLIAEDRFVGIEARYGSRLAAHGADDGVQTAIRAKLASALRSAARVERAAGRSPESLWHPAPSFLPNP
ncbi:MAG: DVU_1551 family NTP transferase [Desulfobacterales bacterium]